jgi:hypothetical protein
VAEREVETVVALLRDGVEVARCAVPADVPPDLAVVDAVARLQLAARRSGCTLELRGDYAQLMELLELVGLAEIVRGLARFELLVEVGREPEAGEELGADEVVPPDDLAP